MGKPKKAAKLAKRDKPDAFKDKKLKGSMVRIFNWSPIQYYCSNCMSALGRNAMVVFHKGNYYCNWSCSDHAD